MREVLGDFNFFFNANCFFPSTRLSIQLENNDALKEALEESLQSKDEDLKVFHKMVEETKKIFLQGLRQFRANATSSAS